MLYSAGVLYAIRASCKRFKLERARYSLFRTTFLKTTRGRLR